MAKNIGKLALMGAILLVTLLGSKYHVSKIDDKYIKKAIKYRHEIDSLLNTDDEMRFCKAVKLIRVYGDLPAVFAREHKGYTMNDSPKFKVQMDSLKAVRERVREAIIDYTKNKEEENKK